MADIVTLTHRNVCKDGFTIENAADAGGYLMDTHLRVLIFALVFLDLPAPWDAVGHAKVALRVSFSASLPIRIRRRILTIHSTDQKDRTARICCFSPCIEQVLRTVTSLNEAGFTGVIPSCICLPQPGNRFTRLPQTSLCTRRSCAHTRSTSFRRYLRSR
jgi:tRNA (adenine57-N1/adenine58-N1)-methyltransferase